MPLSDLLEGNGGWGLGVGLLAGAAILLSKQGRPIAKGALVGYFTLSDRLRTLAAETSEQVQDLVAEAKAEYAERASADRFFRLDRLALPWNRGLGLRDIIDWLRNGYDLHVEAAQLPLGIQKASDITEKTVKANH